eukprot:CAMPEP_0198299212 /NCGR_PEP_ID=MMETSP1449-20131203/43883_1 /TAXON_ID=420275 /ORGANISM="Attheya septentrionalis, Strain CCMP2084" /LENGTH=381 /DNA_ID=CAMNT_0044000699 /DNA_START=73 /DNA_END=1218 /DNA_ORIENTATION=-
MILSTNGLFRHVKSGLDGSGVGIPFDLTWVQSRSVDADEDDDDDELPSHLPVPDFVKVFEYQHATESGNSIDGACETNTNMDDGPLRLDELGRAARTIVDSCFSPSSASGHEAVLFRSLHHVIDTADDFEQFWNGCLQGDHLDDGWTPTSYMPFGKQRAKLGSVDLVTPFPPENALPCHNEMVYNPMSPAGIAFFCLSDAPEGGETILARNAELTKVVSAELQQLVKEHGGIRYRRAYYDQNDEQAVKAAHPFEVSWQEKTGVEDRDEAIKFFSNFGFGADHLVYFNEEGRLIVENVRSGYNDNEDWFNILAMGMFELADGTKVPSDMIQQLQRDEWKPVKALKLRPGDWIVLNNRSVQHGRLPFRESPEQKRVILTVYTK